MWSDLSSLLEDDFSFYRDFVENLEHEENIFEYDPKEPCIFVGTTRIKTENDIVPIVQTKQVEKRKVFKYVTTYKTKPFKVPGHKREFVLECGTYKWVEE